MRALMTRSVQNRTFLLSATTRKHGVVVLALRGLACSRSLRTVPMSKASFIALFLGLVALWLPRASAQSIEGESLEDPKTEAQAFDIAQRTMSPFCPGRTLADCPSGKATEWRQDIRAMLEQGKSAAEIQKILNERAGTNLTGTPESSLGWALPVGLCLGALGVLTLVLRRIRREEAPTEQAGRRAAGAEADGADHADDSDEIDDDQQMARAKHDKELEDRLRRELADEDGGP
jgi:cytochrome c-type biogenesis protein CcmH/NrfF